MTRAELAALKNIGEKTAQWLIDVGVENRADLEALGPVEVYRRLKDVYKDRVTILALYALEGALVDLHWNAIPPERKAELRALAES